MTGSLEFRVHSPAKSYTFKTIEKATKCYLRCIEDEHRLGHLRPDLGPWSVQARYVGPWEPVDDAEDRMNALGQMEML